MRVPATATALVAHYWVLTRHGTLASTLATVGCLQWRLDGLADRNGLKRVQFRVSRHTQVSLALEPHHLSIAKSSRGLTGMWARLCRYGFEPGLLSGPWNIKSVLVGIAGILACARSDTHGFLVETGIDLYIS